MNCAVIQYITIYKGRKFKNFELSGALTALGRGAFYMF